MWTVKRITLHTGLGYKASKQTGVTFRALVLQKRIYVLLLYLKCINIYLHYAVISYSFAAYSCSQECLLQWLCGPVDSVSHFNLAALLLAADSWEEVAKPWQWNGLMPLFFSHAMEAKTMKDKPHGDIILFILVKIQNTEVCGKVLNALKDKFRSLEPWREKSFIPTGHLVKRYVHS